MARWILHRAGPVCVVREATKCRACGKAMLWRSLAAFCYARAWGDKQMKPLCGSCCKESEWPAPRWW